MQLFYFQCFQSAHFYCCKRHIAYNFLSSTFLGTQFRGFKCSHPGWSRSPEPFHLAILKLFTQKMTPFPPTLSLSEPPFYSLHLFFSLTSYHKHYLILHYFPMCIIYHKEDGLYFKKTCFFRYLVTFNFSCLMNNFAINIFDPAAFFFFHILFYFLRLYSQR